jgi:VWFA-related protein
MRRVYPFVSVAVQICLALTALGQQRQQQQTAQESGGYVLNVKSQIVLLDVVVNDKMGNNIHGLTKDDFTVYEDKSPQAIRSFEEVVPTPIDKVLPIHSTAELDKLEPNAPVSIIVLDELSTSFVDLAFARYSLQRYLGTQGDTLAQPTLLLAVDYKNVKVLRDYTTSRKEVLDALEHHLAGYTTAMQNPSFYGEQIDAAFGSLIGVAEATAGHAGHKNMIWVGRGFPIVDPDYTTPETIQDFRDLVATTTNLLRASRVTLYTVDPAGISAAPPQRDGSRLNANDPFASEFDFRTIAFVTGGQTFSDHNDVDRMIGESARDGRSFYTLSYRPPGTSEAAKSFRNIRIVVKNPELHVSTRQGYFEGDVPVAPVREADGKYSKSMLLDIGVASNSLLVYDGVPLTIVRDPAKADRFLLEMKAGARRW